MPVSFTGLDMSWLSDPANRLPPRPKVKKWRAPNKRSTKVASPMFMSDISPFVNLANGEKTHVISSRSQLREFQRDFKCHQVGNDYKPGEIGAKNQAAWQAREELAKGVESGWGDL